MKKRDTIIKGIQIGGVALFVIGIFFLLVRGSIFPDYTPYDEDCLNEFNRDYCLANNCEVVRELRSGLKAKIYDYNLREYRYIDNSPYEYDVCKKEKENVK